MFQLHRNERRIQLQSRPPPPGPQFREPLTRAQCTREGDETCSMSITFNESPNIDSDTQSLVFHSECVQAAASLKLG